VPIFIDESGDTGFEEHSSKFFRLAAVWVAKDRAEGLRKSIDAIRKRFGLKSTFKFKYAKSHHHPEHRDAIFRAAIDSQFRFAFCGIDKSPKPPNTVSSESLFDIASRSIAVAIVDILRPQSNAPGERFPRFAPIALPWTIAKIRDFSPPSNRPFGRLSAVTRR
jgi:hypothetical protein